MKCRVCGSSDIRVKEDIYGLDSYGKVVPGRYKFRVDAGEGQTWESNGQRYKYETIFDAYLGNMSHTLTKIKRQYGVRLMVKQFGQCSRCGFHMNLKNGNPYNVKP